MGYPSDDVFESARSEVMGPEDTSFEARVNQYAMMVHAQMDNKGFWEDFNPDDVRHQLALIALLHTEPSEAAEAIRKGDVENFAEEIADTIIRCLDIAGHFEIPIGTMIEDKMNKNRLRPRKHGKLA